MTVVKIFRVLRGLSTYFTQIRLRYFEVLTVRLAISTICAACFLHPASAQQMVWGSNLKTAQQQAKASNQVLLVDFGAAWCGACKILDANAFHDAAVIRLSAQMISVRMDVDTPSGKEAARPYKIAFFPTVLFLTPDGKVIDKFVGAYSSAEVAVKMRGVLAHWNKTHGKDAIVEASLQNKGDMGASLPISGAEPAVLPQTVRSDVTIEDFEQNTFAQWEKTGNCWGKSADGTEGYNFANGLLSGWQGRLYATTAHPRRAGDPSDSGTGRAVSPSFVITSTTTRLKVAGGMHPDECCVRLLVDNVPVRSATGDGTMRFRNVTWDIAEFAGKKGCIEIVDTRAVGPKGYLFVDDIVQVGSGLSVGSRIATGAGTSSLLPPPNGALPLSTLLPSAEDTPSTTGQRQALETLNQLRAKAGLIPFRWSNRLAVAAQSHSEYLIANNQYGHEEYAGRPGFTGADPAARAASAGYKGGAWEDLAENWVSPENAILGLFAVPYHRRPMLHTDGRDVGIGIAGRYMVTVNFSSGHQGGVVVWPTNDQTGVSVQGDVFESPYPLRIYDLPKGTVPVVGYVVSYFCFNEGLRVQSAALHSETGQIVDCWVNGPENDPMMQDGVILIPKHPLMPFTSYIATVAASDGRGRDVSRRWKFRTGAAAPIKKK